MGLHFSDEIEKLIQDHMATGRYGSEEDLLLQAFQALDEDEIEISAIEEGLASIDRGDAGVSITDAFQRLREKHGT